MKLALACFSLLSSSLLRADFGYENRTEITGGALLKIVLERGAKAKPSPAACYIKGSRMADVTREHATVVNLDNESVLEIDFSRKTFSLRTFEQVKPAIPAGAFESSSTSGGTKNIGILSAAGHLVTMNGPPALARLFLEYWTMTPPGAAEMQDFRRRLAAKLGYAYASGLLGIARINSELLPAFEQAGKVLIESPEMPVESTLRIGTGELAPPAEKPQSKPGITGRIGHLAHRKTAPADDPALLAEVTIELSSFSAGPADESKFGVPAGFKEVKPDASRAGR